MMAKFKNHGITFSDLGGNDWNAICKDLDHGVTHEGVIDNRRSSVAKLHVLLKMSTDLGAHWATLDQGYVSPGEIDDADLSVLGLAVNCFEVAWLTCGAGWQHTGVCATPGHYFKVIGIRWDEHDVPILIHVEAP